MKSYKKEELIPTFAEINLQIKSGGYKTKKKFAKLIMETELQNKHYQVLKTRKKLDQQSFY